MRQDQEAMTLPIQTHLRAIVQQQSWMSRALFSRACQDTWSLSMGWDGKTLSFFFSNDF